MNKDDYRKNLESSMYWLRSAVDCIKRIDLEDEEIPSQLFPVLNDCILRAKEFLPDELRRSASND